MTVARRTNPTWWCHDDVRTINHHRAQARTGARRAPFTDDTFMLRRRRAAPTTERERLRATIATLETTLGAKRTRLEQLDAEIERARAADAELYSQTNDDDVCADDALEYSDDDDDRDDADDYAHGRGRYQTIFVRLWHRLVPTRGVPTDNDAGAVLTVFGRLFKVYVRDGIVPGDYWREHGDSIVRETNVTGDELCIEQAPRTTTSRRALAHWFECVLVVVLELGVPSPLLNDVELPPYNALVFAERRAERAVRRRQREQTASLLQRMGVTCTRA